MNILKEAGVAVLVTADATTAAAGAVGGAAVNGALGAVRGMASGFRTGLTKGRGSTPAAALTLTAIGVSGLVDWPLLVAVGGTALLVHELSQRAATTRGTSSGNRQVRSVAALRRPSRASTA